MDIPKLIRKLKGLCKLAVRQAGKPEGENARAHMDTMMENSSVKITDEMLEDHEALCECTNDWDVDLAKITAMITGADAARLKNGKIRFRGTRVSVEEAEKHYIKQRDAMYKTSVVAVLGHMMGSFGKDVLDEWLSQSGDVSETVKVGMEESENNSRIQDAFSGGPTDVDGELLVAAAVAGAKDPIKLWGGLETT